MIFLRIILLCSFLCWNALHAQNDTLTFEKDELVDVLKTAAREKKQLMVYYTAAWCGPCKYMENEVFRDPGVIKFIQENFIVMKVDVDSRAGKELSRKFPYRAIPQYNILDHEGNLAYAFSSSMPAQKFITRLRESLDPANSVLAISNRQYERGDRTTAFLRKHLDVQQEYRSSEAYPIYLALWAHSPEEEKADSSMFVLMERYLRTKETADYLFLQKNRKLMDSKFGEKRVNNLLIRPYLHDLEELAIAKNDSLFYKQVKNLQHLDLVVEDRNLYELEKTLLLKMDSLQRFVNMVEGNSWPRAFANDNERKLNAATSIILTNERDKEILLRAKNWIAPFHDDHTQVIVIHGQLEEALGNFEEALSAYKSALVSYKKERPQDNTEPTGILSLIDKIEKIIAKNPS